MLLDYHNEVKIAFILSNIIHIDLQAFLLHAPVICNPYFTMYINNTIFLHPFPFINILWSCSRTFKKYPQKREGGLSPIC